METLTAEIDKLRVTIQQMEPPSSRESIEASLIAEAPSSLEFLSKEYVDFGEFCQHAQREIQRLNSRLLEIKSKVDTIGKAIEDLQDYSYQFHVQIIGVPEIGSPESAKMTSDLCVALFKQMGAHVSLQDIDIAHHVQSHKQNGGPKSWLDGKTCKVDPATVGFSDSVRIFDHLTPNQQQNFTKPRSSRIAINFNTATST